MYERIRKLLINKIVCGIVVSAFIVPVFVVGQETSSDSEKRETREPVFRISKLNEAEVKNKDVPKGIFKPANLKNPESVATENRHPLDRAIELAQASLQDMQSEVRDYTAIMVKREQVNGIVGDPEYMRLKVRCPRKTENGETPFSVYMKFLKPRETAGRQVIWVNGRDDNNLIVHDKNNPAIRFRRVYLQPDGMLAMRGNRYPIYDAGVENLIHKLIKKANRDKQAGMCQVEYRSGAEINKRPCSVIELVHNERKAPYEFHKAQVFIDDELNLPIRYAAYDWPTSPGSKPKLIEEYTYVNLKLNVGLTDSDFDPDNPVYKFPRR